MSAADLALRLWRPGRRGRKRRTAGARRRVRRRAAGRRAALAWRLAAVLAAIACGAAVYQFALRERAVAPRMAPPHPIALIGSGSDAVPVSELGIVLLGYRRAERLELPRLPLASAPARGRLRGPMLAQARVLAAAPAPLRPHLEATRYGSKGVAVELKAGIELYFGDAAQAARKWRAAAAVLADPAITALDYVDLRAPSRPAIGGSGHYLPPGG